MAVPDTAEARREVLADVYREARSCTLCPHLAQTRTQVVFGAGNADADLLFIGEAPGSDEDRDGVPFVGRAGKLLTQLLGEVGIAREDVFIANVLKCRPPDNRNPTAPEIANCSRWLFRQLELIQPTVVVTLGNFATRLLREDQTVDHADPRPGRGAHDRSARGAAAPGAAPGGGPLHAVQPRGPGRRPGADPRAARARSTAAAGSEAGRSRRTSAIAEARAALAAGGRRVRGEPARSAAPPPTSPRPRNPSSGSSDGRARERGATRDRERRRDRAPGGEARGARCVRVTSSSSRGSSAPARRRSCAGPAARWA